MQNADQLELNFVMDGETPLAQVIRLTDDAVVAQLSAHLANLMQGDYNDYRAEGDDHLSASRRAICNVFHYAHLVTKDAYTGVFVRKRNIKDIPYGSINQGDVVIARDGKRKVVKQVKSFGSFSGPVITFYFEDGSYLDYNNDYTFRMDRSESVCDLVYLERKECTREWSSS